MAEILDHVAYLSQRIGPRPAGTEEERQAALYIEEELKNASGLSTSIEDFDHAPTSELPLLICCACSFVMAILALFIGVLGPVAIVITLITAVLFVLEAFGIRVLSRIFARGISQNVVAKYVPRTASEANNSQKVVVVARYDSGKVRTDLNHPIDRFLPILRWAELVAMVAIPILLIFYCALFMNDTGAATIFLQVLIVIAIIVVAERLLFMLFHEVAEYNAAANSNAAGTAVLLEVAKNVGYGRMSDIGHSASFSAQQATIHGEEAAREADLVPEGTQIEYDLTSTTSGDSASPASESRLSAAKAAVAALSGRPESSTYSSDISQNLVQAKDFAKEPSETPTDDASEKSQSASAVAGAAGLGAVATGDQAEFASATSEGESTVPDWFKNAQKKADRSKIDDKPIQRSRYADALDAAVKESSRHFEAANQAVEKHFNESIANSNVEEMQEKSASEQETAEKTAAEELSGKEQEKPLEETQEISIENSNPLDPAATTSIDPIDVSTLNLEDEQASNTQSAEVAHVEEGSFSGAQYQEDLSVQPLEEQPVAPYAEQQPIGESANAENLNPIDLADAGASAANLTPITEAPKQRAPLADVETAGKSAAKSLLTMLPSINIDDTNDTTEESDTETMVEQTADSAQDINEKRSALRATLPSLSGAIRRSDVSENASSSVSLAGSFAPAGATGAFAPIGDELLENVDPDEVYVDDADDSAYEENITRTGAYAGPGYVEMPKSRFGRRKRKAKKEEATPQEWLNVDESFDARTVGAERGSWKSFRDEDSLLDDDDTWEGGAVSLSRGSSFFNASSGRGESTGRDGSSESGLDDNDLPFVDLPFRAGRQSNFYADTSDPNTGTTGYEIREVSEDTFTSYVQNNDDENQQETYQPYNLADNQDTAATSLPTTAERTFVGSSMDTNVNSYSSQPEANTAASQYSDEKATASDYPADDDEDYYDLELYAPTVSDELEEVYRFRNVTINSEVWFVALGAELASNAGMRAFLNEHANELRGAIIIDLDALGAGQLCTIDTEGVYRLTKSTSRVKRSVQKASQAAGLRVGSAQLKWENTATSLAAKEGFSTIHLAGMDGSKPAFYGQANDTLENVNPKTMQVNTDFVMELLKNI